VSFHPLARLSLVARLMLGAGFAIVVTGSLGLWISTGKDADFASDQLERHLAENAESLFPTLSEWVVIGDYANIEQVLQLWVKHTDIERITWTNVGGQTLTASDKANAPQAPGWFVRWSGVTSPQLSRALVLGQHNYGQVTLVMTATPAIDRLWDRFLSHLTLLALELGLVLVGILLILRNGLRPLAALNLGARALERGELSARIQPQGSPELVRVIDAFNRMAEQLQAAQVAISQESERLAVTLSSIGDGVIATDAEGRIEFMNPVAEALTGWTAAEAARRSIRQVFPIINESSRQEADSPVERVIREGTVVGLANHTLLIARDGSERPIADSAAPIRQSDGHITGAVLVFRDQTQDRQTLSRLNMAASVFENSLNGVAITDAEQRIIEINPAFTRITGYSREDVIGQTPRLLASGRQDAAFYASMWTEIVTTGQWRGEIWNRHKDGHVYPEDLSIVAIKDRDDKLIRYVGVFGDISQIKAQQEKLQHLAHYDALTGLPNRALLTDRMRVALAQAERSGERLAVCYLDLDGFKLVNDTWGHVTGDRLLEQIAERLRGAVRGGDTVARMGGDEFVLLLANLADIDECGATLLRVLHDVAEPITVEGATLKVSASIGVTLFPDDGADADRLLRHADQALYAAKQAGRNCYQLFDPIHNLAVRQRQTLLARLETALAQGEFCLYYQPKVDMRAGTVIGAEALIRWRDPERGLIAPIDFLPQMEGTALEIEVGEWVIDSALAQMDAWRAVGLNLPLAVNIAPPHLARIDFVARLQSLLQRHPDTPPKGLELEVLESAALNDINHVSKLIEACQRIGVDFALDDFGTGYSSLTYLKRLPAQLIKIDQSFVRDILVDVEDLAIVEGVIGLAEAFHINVIAEGIESVEQGLALLHLGCSLGQGYVIARPMPASEMVGWVAAWRQHPLWQQAYVSWSRDDAVLLGAELDHRLWIDQLQACLDAGKAGAVKLPTMDFHLCRFGRWYHGPGQVRYGSICEYQELNALHQRIHAVGNEIGTLCNAGQHGQASVCMTELTALRDQFVAQLHVLAEVIKAGATVR